MNYRHTLLFLFISILTVPLTASSLGSLPNPQPLKSNSLQKDIDGIFQNAPFAALKVDDVTNALEASKKSPSGVIKTLFHMKHKIGDLYVTDSVFDQIKAIVIDVQNIAKKPNEPFASPETIKNLDALLEIRKECKDQTCLTEKLAGKPIQDFGSKIFANTPPYAPQEQHVKAIKKILSSTIPIVLFEGVPGSGKTASALTWIVATLHELGKKVYTTAPNAGGYAALQGDFKKTPEVVKSFGDVLGGKIDQGAFLIIDEVYMTSLSDFQKLLEVASKHNLKLIFSGDSQQNLPAVVPIVGILDLLPIVHLYESNRASSDEHKKFAGIAARNSISAALKNFEKDIMIVPQTKIIDTLTLKALHDIKKPETDKPADTGGILFVASNEQVNSLNDAFHEILMKNSYVLHPQEITVSYNVYDRKAYLHKIITRKIHVGVGTRIFMKEADAGAGISAGAMGTITHINGPQLTVNFNGASKTIDTKTFNKFDYAYALSSATSQGMSVSNVFVWLDKNMTMAELYVALTRHKNTIFIVAPQEEFKTEESILTYDWKDFNKEVGNRMKVVMADVIESLKSKT